MHLQEISHQAFFKRINLKIRFLYFCGLLLLILVSKNSLFLSLVFLVHFCCLLNRNLRLKEFGSIFLEPLFVAFLLVLIKSLDFSSLEHTIILLKENLFLGLRVLSAFSLFLFFQASLSFFEILKLMNWLKIPSFFQELLFLSFKFISLLKEDMFVIYLTQKNRLGYSSVRKTLRSLKYLAQASFFRALEHSENTLQSMQQRGFNFNNLVLSIEPIKEIEIFLLVIILMVWVFLWIIL